jgi:hypothetical protein
MSLYQEYTEVPTKHGLSTYNMQIEHTHVNTQQMLKKGPSATTVLKSAGNKKKLATSESNKG